MKKISLLIMIFIITSCGKKNIIVEKPISIYFDDNIIVEKDYQNIIDTISTINFYCGKLEQQDETKYITITTNENIYKFAISSNYYMTYQNNNNYCYTRNTTEVKNLVILLESTIEKYKDTSFFNIRSEFNYQIDENESFIKLDKSNNYIIINSLYPLYNFKINQIKYNNDSTYKETDLLYSIDKIDKNVNIVIKKEILDIPDFKISFNNEYDYLINILPFITDNKVNFLTKITK